ncbi:alpha-L-glutamate ligase-like protein [Amphritea balenae]|uniref:Alpha-L-glutamate ligase-like protein n=1 Tax=Amphritea balenae TaxID=452629 RepID=A0A3P1SU38_9GAMM|nr:alpha-L-glutamate ligase-like protein [Amphritea balenae]RRD00066.1 alpha-L-glutamate ligase-like protein [Amphritea balenae]GGK76255.1 alpha-L-glutamate ligase-like protein [Amphritea balenae]
MGWFISSGKLRDLGVLGMNERNIDYISRHNERRLFPLVDDKLKTKKLALAAGLKVPDLLGVVRYQHQVREIAELLHNREAFCIKPSKGSGGKGILVIHDHDDEQYFKPNNQALSLVDIKRHTSNILAGLYSLGGQPDKAIIEDLIHFDEQFIHYSYEGVPDIRIIVFRGFPVMAMMRLSTAASDGKANLHQGAVGVGLDIATGVASHAVQFDRPVTDHPDTGMPLTDIRISDWHRLLHMGAHCFEMSGLGYLGVDIVLDARHGPMLLELNARPGLAIQIANSRGLSGRLQSIEAIGDQVMTAEERVAFVETQFA